MKRLLWFVLVILFVSGELVAQEEAVRVRWYAFEEAVQLAGEKPKKLFIDVYTDWCGWCKRMDQNTFSHPVIAEYLNTHFYPVKFNAESTDPVEFSGRTFINEGEGKRNPHQLAIALLQGRMSYPSIAYMTEDLQLITAVPGYMEPKGIEPILNFFATNKYQNMSWQDYQKEFVSSIR